MIRFGLIAKRVTEFVKVIRKRVKTRKKQQLAVVAQKRVY